MGPVQTSATDLPVACCLRGIDAAARPRHAELFARLRAAVVGVAELPDGLLVTLPAEAAMCRDVMEWATLERRCCPFLTIGIELLAGGGPLHLTLRGPAGTRELLAEIIATGVLPESDPNAGS